MNEILKTLTIKVFHMNKVSLADKTKLAADELLINSKIYNSAFDDIEEVKVSLLQPYQRNIEVNTIFDIIPISTKVYGVLGEGVTNTLTGVYALLTARQSSGEQFFNFGHCFGDLTQIIQQDKIGTFSDSDYLIHIDVITKNDSKDPKKTVYNVHALADQYIQEIRNELKNIDPTKAIETHVYHEKFKPQKERVVMIKQVSGMGAMMDTWILPSEPSGVEGGYSIIDGKNLPIVLSPNEYRDGAIRSME